MNRAWLIKLLIAVGFLLALSLVGVWYYLRATESLPVKHVQVAGDFAALGKERVEKMLLPYVERGMFNVDAANITARLKQFPSVKAVKISHVWPHTIRVKIVQYKIVAQLSDDELVAEDGHRFHPQLSLDLKGVPLFIAPPGANFDKSQKMYQQLTQILGAADLKITIIEATRAGEWQVKTGKGFWIYCGDNDIDSHLQRFVRAYPVLMADNEGGQLSYVDLRYNTGFAANWQ